MKLNNLIILFFNFKIINSYQKYDSFNYINKFIKKNIQIM